MGCWNESCSLSNLPIFDGEEIVLILVKVTEEGKANIAQNRYEIFQPVGLPFYGTYDDYGSINLDPSRQAYHATIFAQLTQAQGDTEVIEEWLRNISQQGHGGSDANDYSQVMFKRSIFDAVLAEVGKERGGWGDNAGPHSERLMKTLKDTVDTFALPVPEDSLDAARHEFVVVYEATRSLRHYFRHDTPEDFLKPGIVTQETIDGAYHLSLLDIALMRLRRTWTPLHGTSTQDIGTAVQKALLAASQAEVNRVDDEYFNYDED